MKKITSLFNLLLAALLFACNVEQPIESPVAPEPKPDDGNLRIAYDISNLTNSDAQKVARAFMFNNFSKQSKARTFTPTRVGEELSAIRDSLGNALAWVVNFADGGFCIISATKKSMPILAYSDSGAFDLSRAGMSGVSVWIAQTSDAIVHQEPLTGDELAALNRMWAEYEDFSIVPQGTKLEDDPVMLAAFNKEMANYSAESGKRALPLHIAKDRVPNDLYLQFKSVAERTGSPERYTIIEIIDLSTTTTVGPLMTSNWHQYRPFNLKVPFQDPAGCVPVALGQIMKYHRHPATYNWSNMEDDNYLYNEDVQDLMIDIGRAVHITYNDKGSGTTVFKAEDGIKEFNYEVIRRRPNPSDVGNEIRNNKRPVYMDGAATNAFLGIFFNDGHAWVCDGLKSHTEIKEYKIYYIVNNGGSYSYLSDGRTYTDLNVMLSQSYDHYNWGWGDVRKPDGTIINQNGWYTSAHPRDSEYNFKYDRWNMYIFPLK